MIKQTDEKNFNSGNTFFQSRFWAELKKSFGWKPYYFNLGESSLLVLARKFKPGFSLAYIPYGPDKKYMDKLPEISNALKDFLPRNCIFIRYDFSWETGSFTENYSGNSGSCEKPAVESELSDIKILKSIKSIKSLKKSVSDIQPPSTVILDLSPDEETLFASMKSKTRYNIRLSEKKGIKTVRGGVELLDKWYEIYTETAERDKITLHSLEYYKKIFELSGFESADPRYDKESGTEMAEPLITLYMAESGSTGNYIAGIVTCCYKRQAYYLYGASLNREREKMPAYALQWQAVKDAKSRGCISYDFFGIPEDDNPSHPMHGLYRFKTGFGGRIIHRPGCYDFPLKPLLYNLYRAAEFSRLFYYKKIRKQGR